MEALVEVPLALLCQVSMIWPSFTPDQNTYMYLEESCLSDSPQAGPGAVTTFVPSYPTVCTRRIGTSHYH